MRRDVGWAFAGNVVFSGCQWGQVLILARFGSTQAVGDFAFATSIVVPIMTLSMLHLRSLQATDAGGEHRYGEYLALRLLTTFAAVVSLGSYALLGNHGDEMRGLLLGAIALSAADAFSDLGYGVLQQTQRLERMAWALIIKGPLGLLVLTQTLWQGSGEVAAMWGLAATRWIILVSCEIPWIRDSMRTEPVIAGWWPTWHPQRLSKLLWKALPLGLVMLMVSLQTHLPRVLLERAAGRETLGIFAGLTMLTQIGGLAVNALGQAASPRLARFDLSGETRSFQSLTLKLILLAAGLGLAGVIGAALYGAEFLRLLYGEPYAAHTDSLIVLMAAAAVAYTAGPLGFAATASRRIRHQPVVHAVNLVLLGSLAAWGAKYGLFGISVALLASSLVITALYAVLLCLPRDGSSLRSGSDHPKEPLLPMTRIALGDRSG